MTEYFDARDELRNARDTPDPAGYEDSRAYNLEQRFRASAARIERAQIAAANTAKMRELEGKLDSGELDQADPVRRWYHGLAPGERHMDRELAELDRELERWAADAEYGRDGGGGNIDGKLASILTDRLHPGDSEDEPHGNMTGREALAELGIEIRHRSQ